MAADNNMEMQEERTEESRLQHIKHVTEETASGLIRDWRAAVDNAVGQAEQFTKEKPMVALAASFAAGVVLAEVVGLLIRRRS